MKNDPMIDAKSRKANVDVYTTFLKASLPDVLSEVEEEPSLVTDSEDYDDLYRHIKHVLREKLEEFRNNENQDVAHAAYYANHDDLSAAIQTYLLKAFAKKRKYSRWVTLNPLHQPTAEPYDQAISLMVAEEGSVVSYESSYYGSYQQGFLTSHVRRCGIAKLSSPHQQSRDVFRGSFVDSGEVQGLEAYGECNCGGWFGKLRLEDDLTSLTRTLVNNYATRITQKL
tara:strand:- start:734 stop:1414 length:681 start_codon:yes stop_codon:yes gene_type:complete